MFKSVFSKLNLSTYDNAVFFTSKILLHLLQSLTAPPTKKSFLRPCYIICTLPLTSFLVIKVVEISMEESQAIKNGRIYVEERRTILLTMSIGNSYFYKVETLEKLMNFSKTNSDQVR